MRVKYSVAVDEGKVKEYKLKRQKNLDKYKRQYEERKEFHKLLKEYASDIIASENFRSTRNYIQHGSMPVYRHCMDVADQSIKISKLLRVNCNERELIRGALLHDYFLYDWHDKNHIHKRPHGFYHPQAALDNARQDFLLNEREENMIKRHMFPLTLVPPRYKEAWILCYIDKVCSGRETVKRS